jgi:hypothetical protein
LVREVFAIAEVARMAVTANAVITVFITDIPPQMPSGTVDAKRPGLRQFYALAARAIIFT